MTDRELESFLAHEAAYFGFGAQVVRHQWGWSLEARDLPQSHDLNRVLRPRMSAHCDAATVAGAIASHFAERGLPTIVDVDRVAEAEGIGQALRRNGIMPVMSPLLLMRYEPSVPPTVPERGVTVERLARETGQGEARLWIETLMTDEVDSPPETAHKWRRIAEKESRSPDCQLYLARLDGKPAAVCDVFARDGWARIDSVATAPQFRRRGAASVLIARAVRDALTAGNRVIYLFTEKGGAGEALYRKLGFTVWETQALRRHIGRA